MANITSFGENEPPRGSTVRQRVVSLEEARAIDSFGPAVELFEKWLTLPGAVPQHQLITPSFIGPQLLPLMYIVDVLDDDADNIDFQWRLFGTSHSVRYGKEATGILMSYAAELDESAAGSYKIAKMVYETGEPCFFLTEFIKNDRVNKTTSTVVLPLADEAGKMVRLFGCAIWA